MWLNLVCGFAVLVISTGIGALMATGQSPLEVVKQWHLLTYNFEYSAPIDDKDFYNPQNILLTGLAVGYDRIFVASPRLFSGVPATVSTVSRADFGDSPVLEVCSLSTFTSYNLLFVFIDGLWFSFLGFPRLVVSYCSNKKLQLQ